MDRDVDVSDQVKRDVERFKRLRQVGSGSGMPLGVKMEYTFWTLSILSVIGMIVTMFFAGPDKAIPGGLWLGASLGSICVFGGLALVMRQLPEV